MTTPFEELTHHAESALRILRGATHSRAARDAAGCLTEGLARAKALEALAATAPLPSESEGARCGHGTPLFTFCRACSDLARSSEEGTRCPNCGGPAVNAGSACWVDNEGSYRCAPRGTAP